MKLSTLDMLTQVSENPSREILAPDAIPEKMQEQMVESRDYVANSKKFLLDVKLTQPFYDSYEDGRIQQFKEFVLPFGTCLFAFDNPLTIKWTEKEGKVVSDQQLLAICVRQLPSILDRNIFKAYLYFQEQPLDDETIMISNQFITFSPLQVDGQTQAIALKDHLCLNKMLCMVENRDKNLDYWKNRTDDSKFYACQAAINTEAMIETLMYIVDRIHTSQPILVEKKSDHNKTSNGETRPTMPFGWPFTKGNLPKDNYTQYLDGKHYVYDKDDIAYGSGVKHRYRYDVRRHPRIIKGHLIWINYHQRGSGSYIPKIYANRKTWFVNYIWSKAEQLSKYRIFEIMMIKILSFLKKH